MQVGFKKVKAGWMQELFNSLATSPILCKPIENTQQPWKNDIIRFQPNGQERIIHPPDLAFRLDAKLINKLKDKLQRSRRPVQGILVADSLDVPVGSFMESAEEDVGAVQEADGVFCIGVVLSRGEGQAELQRRVKEQLRRCSERSGAIYSHNSKNSSLSELSKATIRQLRIFLLFDEGREGLSVGRLFYLPRANIPLRKIKILQPSALTSNEVLAYIKNSLNFKRQVMFGYISLNPGNNGDKHKFILLDRNDPQLMEKVHPPMLGVWAAGNLGSGLQRDAAIWSVIMEYLTDPHITKRLSIAGERTGLFFAFQDGTKDRLTPYAFQFPVNARWNITSRVESVTKIPQQYAFSQQEVIMEEEREESEVQSISSKQDRTKINFQESNEPISARLLEQKDAEIKRLRIELDFYKTQCEKLQQALNNMNVLQLAQKTLTNSLPIYPPLRNNPVSPPEQELNLSDGPFFGRKSEYEGEPISKIKEFAVRDMKNISFAQENSFDEEIATGSILDKNLQLKFATPEFKQTREFKAVPPKDIKAFNFKKNQDDQDLKNRKEEQKDKGKNVENKEKEKVQVKEKSFTPIRNLEEKYDNYKNFSKNISSSPKLKEKNSEEQDRKLADSEKNSPKKEEPPRKTVFLDEPREKRIKNELYSQEKDPRKDNMQTTNGISKSKNPSEVKSPQKTNNNRSKSPIQPQGQKTSKVLDSDSDEQLNRILKDRKKK